jgi:hypothetical protein
MDWQDKTCELCKFAIDGECRRFPPYYEYPSVRHRSVAELDIATGVVTDVDAVDWMPACSEYKV